jgi:outer membrane protein assembly factor BamB
MPPTGYPTMTLVVNGILYMESSSSLSLYALRPTDGSLLWQYPAASLLAVWSTLRIRSISHWRSRAACRASLA